MSVPFTLRFVTLLLLGALPAAAAEPVAAQTRADESGVVLWIEPLWPMVSLLANPSRGSPNSRHLLYLPLGVSVPLAAHRALTVELSVGAYTECGSDTGPRCYARARFGRLSVGHAFSSSGQQRGFFVQPRLGLTLLRRDEKDNDTGGPASSPSGSIGLEAGADFGYQWRIGHGYVATMLGFGLGFITNGPEPGPMLAEQVYAGSRGRTRPAVSLNLNLLRIGWGG